MSNTHQDNDNYQENINFHACNSALLSHNCFALMNCIIHTEWLREESVNSRQTRLRTPIKPQPTWAGMMGVAPDPPLLAQKTATQTGYTEGWFDWRFNCLLSITFVRANEVVLCFEYLLFLTLLQKMSVSMSCEWAQLCQICTRCDTAGDPETYRIMQINFWGRQNTWDSSGNRRLLCSFMKNKIDPSLVWSSKALKLHSIGMTAGFDPN